MLLVLYFYPQAILKSKAYLQKEMTSPSIEKVLENLKSPVTWFGKLLLRKWIVPKARHAVGQREWGKVDTIMILNFRTDRSGQTVQSDQGLHCMLSYVLVIDKEASSLASLFEF